MVEDQFAVLGQNLIIIVFGLIIFLPELFANKFYLHLCLVKMCITGSSQYHH